MNCPPELADVLTKLIEAGILRIRSAAWAGDSQRCVVEADHIHNLPGLLTNFSDGALRYYWEAERPAFLAQSSGETPWFWITCGRSWRVGLKTAQHNHRSAEQKHATASTVLDLPTFC